MNPRRIAAGMIIFAFVCLAMAFLTGCAGIGSPQVCLKTDYGTFCYALPELPKPTSSK
jgi:hypothetical protein